MSGISLIMNFLCKIYIYISFLYRIIYNTSITFIDQGIDKQVSDFTDRGIALLLVSVDRCLSHRARAGKMPTCRTAALLWRRFYEGGEEARRVIIGQICTSFSLAEPEIEFEELSYVYVMMLSLSLSLFFVGDGCRFFYVNKSLGGEIHLRIPPNLFDLIGYLRLATEFIRGNRATTYIPCIHIT